VAVAVLIAVLLIVATVFSISGRATSLAAANADVYRHLRMISEQIRQDLAGVDPANSCLAIYARKVLAYRNPQDRASLRALSDPRDAYRADILMFFTNRRAQPYAWQPSDPSNPKLFGGPVQVVYGHADIGQVDADGNWSAIRRVDRDDSVAPGLSDLTSLEWHLARRCVILTTAALDGVVSSGVPTDPDILDATSDVLLFDYASEMAGLPYQPGDLIPDDWYYDGVGTRTLLDPDPPAQEARRLAYYFLPACASFKVEYTYDCPEMDNPAGEGIEWRDPLIDYRGDPNRPEDPAQVPPRREWVKGDFRYQPGLTGDYTSWFTPPTWPRALRITIEVYDRRGTLKPTTAAPIGTGGRPLPPIRHVIIHTWP